MQIVEDSIKGIDLLVKKGKIENLKFKEGTNNTEIETSFGRKFKKKANGIFEPICKTKIIGTTIKGIDLLVINGEIEELVFVNGTENELIATDIGRFYKKDKSKDNFEPIVLSYSNSRRYWGFHYYYQTLSRTIGNSNSRQSQFKSAARLVAQYFLDDYSPKKEVKVVDESAQFPFHHKNLKLLQPKKGNRSYVNGDVPNQSFTLEHIGIIIMIDAKKHFITVFKDIIDAASKSSDTREDILKDINGKRNNSMCYYLSEKEYHEAKEKYKGNDLIKYLLARRKLINMRAGERSNIEKEAEAKKKSPEECCIELVETELLEDQVRKCNELYKIANDIVKDEEDDRKRRFFEGIENEVFSKELNKPSFSIIKKICNRESLNFASVLWLFHLGIPFCFIPDVIRTFDHYHTEYFINGVSLKAYCKENEDLYEKINSYSYNRKSCIEIIKKLTGEEDVEAKTKYYILKGELQNTFGLIYSARQQEKDTITIEDLKAKEKVMTSATNPQ